MKLAEIKILLPEKVSTNTIYAGVHWSVRQKHTVLFQNYLWHLKGKINIKTYPVEISYRFTFKRNPLDTTNVSYMAKLLEDALVVHRVIDGDNPSHVAATHVYSEKGPEDAVTIEICSTRT